MASTFTGAAYLEFLIAPMALVAVEQRQCATLSIDHLLEVPGFMWGAFHRQANRSDGLVVVEPAMECAQVPNDREAANTTVTAISRNGLLPSA